MLEKPRKERGPHIEETALMKQLDTDPAAAMQALAEETAVDWQENAPPLFKNLLDAQPDETDGPDS